MIMRSALIIFALFLAAPVTAAPVAFVNVNVLPMSDDSIVEAHRAMEDNSAGGKIVVTA